MSDRVSSDAGGESAADVSEASAILWVEPLAGNWSARLKELAQVREVKTIVILNSGWLAAWLPERKGWPAPPSWGQVRCFWQELKAQGFKNIRVIGVHTLLSILLNQLSHQAGRFGRPALADRLQFASRQKYSRRGWTAFATVGLLFIERKNTL